MAAINDMVKYWGKDASPEVPDNTIREMVEYVLTVLTATDYKIYQMVYTGPDRQVRKIRLVPRDVSDGSILVRLLGKDFHSSINRQAATCLADLASSYENQMKIASFPRVIDSLVQLLGKAEGSIVNEHTARCLANLAQTRENHLKIVSFSSLDALVKLLEKDTSPAVRLQTVRCLTNLAESQGVRIASHSGAFDALLRCMGSWGSSPLHRKVQKNATKCLTYLANMQENQLKIVAYRRALQTVVRLLGINGSCKVQRQAAKLLTILSDHHDSNRVIIASHPGLLDSLLRIMRHNWCTTLRISVQSEVARCLFNLTSAGENLEMICFHPGALDSVVKCVDPNNYRTQKVQSLAAGCLSRLAATPENRVKMLSTPGTISGLVNLLLRPQNPSGRQLAAWCLCKLSRDEETKIIIASSERVLDCLASILVKQDEDELPEPLVRTIASLALATGNRVRIASHVGVLDALVSLLKSKQDPIVLEETAKCLSYLAAELEIIPRMCSHPGVLVTLVSLLDEESGTENKCGVLENVAKCVANLAYSPENQVLIASVPGMLHALVSLLSPSLAFEGMSKVQEHVVLCLSKLSEASENHMSIASHPGASYALRRLASGDENSLLQKYASSCLGNLRSSAVDRHARLTSGSPTEPFQRRDSLADPDVWYVDPLTHDTMCDPVKGNDGITYDRWTLIDNKDKKFDSNVSTLFILCDDIDVRTRLFRSFPRQEAKFRLRRQEYREQALQDAIAGEFGGAIEKLRNVLKWAPADEKCLNELERVLLVMEQSSSGSGSGSTGSSTTPSTRRRILAIPGTSASPRTSESPRTSASSRSPATPATPRTVVTPATPGTPAIPATPATPPTNAGLATPAIGRLTRIERIYRIPTFLYEEMMHMTDSRAQKVVILILVYVVGLYLSTLFLHSDKRRF